MPKWWVPDPVVPLRKQMASLSVVARDFSQCRQEPMERFAAGNENSLRAGSLLGGLACVALWAAAGGRGGRKLNRATI